MTYANKKPDSPKGRVYTAFSTGGEAAARAVAEKEETVTEGKLRRWFEEWGEDAPAKPATQEKAEAKPQIAQETKTPPAKPKEARRRVYDVGNPNVHGTVLTAGEQVSVVRWDVHSPWGKESNVSNEKLKDVTSAPTKKSLDVFNNVKEFRVMRKDKEHSTHKSFADAMEAADDEGLWVYAISKGGTVVLLMRPHWGIYQNHAEAKE
jgi:hypothetical protein